MRADLREEECYAYGRDGFGRGAILNRGHHSSG
jgi:hypothetical protein